MSNTNHDFEQMTWREDLKLIVEDKSLFVSKVILGLVSPVFNNMFSSQFKEKSQDEIELPGKSFNNVLEFLCCIYPDVLKPITIKNALNVLPLANKYQAEALKRKCELRLEQSVNLLSTNKMLECLCQAHLYRLYRLKVLCLNCASELSKEELYSAERNVKIPVDVMFEILHRKIERQMIKIEDLEESKRNSDAVVDYLVSGIQRKPKRDFIAKNKDSIWKTITFDIADLEAQLDDNGSENGSSLRSQGARVYGTYWYIHVSIVTEPADTRVRKAMQVELKCHPPACPAWGGEIDVFTRFAIYNLDTREMTENADVDCLDFGNGKRIVKCFKDDYHMYVNGVASLSVQAHFCIVRVPASEDDEC